MCWDLASLRIVAAATRSCTGPAASLISSSDRVEPYSLQCSLVPVDTAVALDKDGWCSPRGRHQQLTPAGLITALSGAGWRGAGTSSKAAGRCNRPARSKGAAIAKAGPTTSEVGTKAA